jgi:hypothetical protein
MNQQKQDVEKCSFNSAGVKTLILCTYVRTQTHALTVASAGYHTPINGDWIVLRV